MTTVPAPPYTHHTKGWERYVDRNQTRVIHRIWPTGGHDTVAFAACAWLVNTAKSNWVRDQWGVPHIFAETDEGAMYGLGYACSEDRSFSDALQSEDYAGAARRDDWRRETNATGFYRCGPRPQDANPLVSIARPNNSCLNWTKRHSDS